MSGDYIYTKAEFARLCGVKPPTISRGVKKRNIKVMKSGRIDMREPKNKAFYEKRVVVDPDGGPPRQRPLEERNGWVEPEPVKAPPSAEEGPIPAPPTEKTPEQMTKAAVDIRKGMAQARKTELAIAKDIKSVLPRQMFVDTINRIATIASGQLVPFGQRTSKDITDLCGVEDNKKILEVQQFLEKETEGILSQIVETCTKAVDLDE